MVLLPADRLPVLEVQAGPEVRIGPGLQIGASQGTATATDAATGAPDGRKEVEWSCWREEVGGSHRSHSFPGLRSGVFLLGI